MYREIENRMVVDSEWTWLESDWYSDEAEMVEDLLSIDDEIEDLEAEFGSMDKVDADVLAEIVRDHTGIDPEGVEWDEQADAIVFKYYEEVA